MRNPMINYIINLTKKNLDFYKNNKALSQEFYKKTRGNFEITQKKSKIFNSKHYKKNLQLSSDFYQSLLKEQNKKTNKNSFFTYFLKINKFNLALLTSLASLSSQSISLASESLPDLTDTNLSAKQAFSVGTFDINLMWVNEKRPFTGNFVFPDFKQEEILTVIEQWANKNNTQDTKVNFWFDSKMSPEGSISNTQQLFDAYFNEKNLSCRIILQDIQTLNKVKQHPNVFSKDIPAYFKTDFIRFLIAQEILEKKDRFLYADLNVKPENTQYLFDDKTINNLNTYEIVMLRNDQGEKAHHHGGNLGFENKFMMLRKDPQLKEVIENYLINPLIHKIENVPEGIHFKNT